MRHFGIFDFETERYALIIEAPDTLAAKHCVAGNIARPMRSEASRIFWALGRKPERFGLVELLGPYDSSLPFDYSSAAYIVDIDDLVAAGDPSTVGYDAAVVAPYVSVHVAGAVALH